MTANSGAASSKASKAASAVIDGAALQSENAEGALGSGTAQGESSQALKSVDVPGTSRPSEGAVASGSQQVLSDANNSGGGKGGTRTKKRRAEKPIHAPNAVTEAIVRAAGAPPGPLAPADEKQDGAGEAAGGERVVAAAGTEEVPLADRFPAEDADQIIDCVNVSSSRALVVRSHNCSYFFPPSAVASLNVLMLLNDTNVPKHEQILCVFL